MNMHDERYIITITEDHGSVRLRDQRLGETHVFEGPKALWSALGVLAEWRDRDLKVLELEDSSGRLCVQCNRPGGEMVEDPFDREMYSKITLRRLHPECVTARAEEV